MNAVTLILITVLLVFALVAAFFVYRRIPKKLHSEKFQEDWKQLQNFCRDKDMWSKAVMDADKLLDKALKRRKFKGKRMGERMVSAQRMISNNDQLWFAHNLSKKLVADPTMKLKEADVKLALIGFRQALKDLGALRPSEAATPLLDEDKK